MKARYRSIGEAVLLTVCGLSGSLRLAAETVWVGRFDDAGSAIPAPWRSEQIDPRVPPTIYRLRKWDGVVAVEAHARRSMALLGRPLSIDLQKTPVLCWQWRIDAPVAGADMTRKAGDDYAARVYLTFAVPPERLSLATRAQLRLARSIYGDRLPDAAINYVWDNRQPVGTWRDNAYTDRARMLVLRSGAGRAGAWVHERRNVVEDFQRAFGDIGGELRGLALASDTDNTGEQAHAGFAGFRFVGRADECPAPTGD
ncbi:MAG: DUF3047 domain-containing protein [Candidatus Accumulibacter sp.]|nr:DUF3047 domain-containing protein [Accumulibacter sp.]